MIGTASGLITYALDRDVELDSRAASVALTKATDYMSTLKWVGRKSVKTQEDPWPRIDVNGEPIIDDGQVAGDIPDLVVTAAYRLAIDSSHGVDLLPTLAGPQVTQETVDGAVTIKYQESSIGAAPYFPWLDSLIGEYLDDSGSNGFNFPVGRA